MPTSPGADLQSPPAQNAVFSSPPQMLSSSGSAVGFASLTVAMMPKHSSVYAVRFSTETPGKGSRVGTCGDLVSKESVFYSRTTFWLGKIAIDILF